MPSDLLPHELVIVLGNSCLDAQLRHKIKSFLLGVRIVYEEGCPGIGNVDVITTFEVIVNGEEGRLSLLVLDFDFEF